MVTFLGDVALISDDLSSSYTPPYPYVFNLEYVIGNIDELSPVPNKINLCSAQKNFKDIFGENPVAVNVVNNHIFDFSDMGFEGTLKHLADAQIKVVDDTPVFISQNLCVFSYMLFDNYLTFSFDYEKARKSISYAKEQNPDVRIVVQMHWGIENHPMHNEQQIVVAHWLIDQGVDLVIGHHPHCLQPIEKYNGKYIFYSIGNTLFGNINQPSHYDEKGNYKRIYRFRWQKWNRQSLAVSYDEDQNEVVLIEKLYQKGNVLVLEKRMKSPDVLIKSPCAFTSKILYTLRKYFLFFVSNMFVDEKLFDVKALKHEMGKRK